MTEARLTNLIGRKTDKLLGNEAEKSKKQKQKLQILRIWSIRDICSSQRRHSSFFLKFRRKSDSIFKPSEL